jgi:hypothetical protein
MLHDSSHKTRSGRARREKIAATGEQTFDGQVRSVYYWQVVGGASYDAPQRQDAQSASLACSVLRDRALQRAAPRTNVAVLPKNATQNQRQFFDQGRIVAYIHLATHGFCAGSSPHTPR